MRSHLSDQGVLAINVGRTASDFTLVDALSKTVGQVFPSVYLVDQPGPADNLSNSLLVATVQPTQLTNFTTNVTILPSHFPVEFRHFAQTTIAQARRAPLPAATTPIFTDDRAPVEQVVHRIIWRFLSSSQ